MSDDGQSGNDGSVSNHGSAKSPASGSACKPRVHHPFKVTKARRERCLEYFKATGTRSDSNMDVYECVFCGHSMCRRIERFQKHLVKSCSAIPKDVRKELLEVEEVLEGSASLKMIPGRSGNSNYRPRPKCKRKRSDYMNDMSSDDDEEEDEGELNGDNDDDKDRAVKILTGLLSKAAGGSFNHDLGDRKPLKEYSDSDIDRELKELSVKQARATLRETEERSKVFSRIGGAMDKVLRALDVYIKKEESAMAHAMGNVSNVYSENILQAAYDESVAGSTIRPDYK